MPGTATIRDVELVSVGTWAASTGVTTVTRADLDAMLAAQADGLVDHAPVKLGHVSDLNKGIGDGNPAYGWVVPTRIGVNAAGKETLYGDVVGMPAKLAEVAPTAYRRRSVEIAWGVKTPAGKTYAAVLVGLALLGATPPAVKGLADVLALYAIDPEAEERREAVEVVAGLEDSPALVAMLTAARTAGATVTALDAMAAAAGARDTADVPPPVEDDGNDDHQQTDPQTGRQTMTEDELRAALKLEADADVDAELARIVAERAGEDGKKDEPKGEKPAEDEKPKQEEREPELATLSAATLSELQRDAAWARNTRRANVLDKAVRDGRIAPAERGKLTSELAAGESVTGFAAALERDEDGTTALLGSLSPRFPVTELGSDAAPHAQQAAEAVEKAFDEFEASVFGLDRS